MTLTWFEIRCRKTNELWKSAWICIYLESICTEQWGL